jgi:hypothetical protein
MRARIWREVRPFLGCFAVIAIYAIVRAVFVAAADGDGLLTPTAGVDVTLVVLALATFVLRIGVLVVVPWLVVYGVILRLYRVRAGVKTDRSLND